MYLVMKDIQVKKDKFKEYEEKYAKDKVDRCCEKHNNRKREDFEKCLKGV